MPRQAINNVTLVGHVVEEPTRRGESENAPLIIRLAVAGAGNTRSDTAYWNVVIFGERGDKLATILKKGSSIAVSGSLRKSTWDWEGTIRTETEIIASDIQFTDSPRPMDRPQEIEVDEFTRVPTVPEENPIESEILL